MLLTPELSHESFRVLEAFIRFISNSSDSQQTTGDAERQSVDCHESNGPAKPFRYWLVMDLAADGSFRLTSIRERAHIDEAAELLINVIEPIGDFTS
jgi:hypothetical protein